MAALTQVQQHELIKSMIKLPPRALSIMVSSMGALREKHCLHRMLGPTNFTFMPRSKSVIDILDLYDPAEREYIPSVFSKPCDPAVPIYLQEFEMGTLTSLAPGYMKREFKLGMCDEDLDKIMLRELPGMPWNTTTMSKGEKLSINMFAAAREAQGQAREARVRMFNHSIQYGAFYNSGPGIQVADELIDLRRNPKLNACLQGDGWGNKYASFGKTMEMLARHFSNENKQQCRMTDVIIDEYTASLVEMLVEYQECGKCWAYDPNVIRRQEMFNRNTLPSEQPYAMRGLKQFPYSNPRLPNVNFWVCDEYEKTEICEEVDGVQVGTGQYHMTPVMPQGSMLIVDRDRLNSTALRGNIHHLDVDGPLDQWSETRKSCDGDCMIYRFHQSPMDFAGRVNCSLMVYTSPETCPPPCKCHTIECSPKGGKEVAEAANPLRALGGTADQSQMIEKILKQMDEQQKLIGDVKSENETMAETIKQQAEDIAKLTGPDQVAAATKAVKDNQKKGGAK